MPKKLSPKIDPDEQFPLVANMLYDLAWRATNQHFQFEEAKAEAFWAFMGACDSFDPSRGAKFSTWCHFKVWTHLKTHITKRARDPLLFVDIKEEMAGPAPAQRRDFLDSIDDLSSDARELIRLLIDTPKEVLDPVFDEVPITPRQLLDKVRDHLGYTKGWDSVYTKITLLEIQARYEEVV